MGELCAWSVFVCIWTYMYISGQYKTVWQWIQQHSTVKLYCSGQYVYKSTPRHFLLATKMVYCSFLSDHPSCSQLAKSWPRSWCRTGTSMSTSGMFSSCRSSCWKCSVLSCANRWKQEVGSFPDLDHEQESSLEGEEKGLSHFSQLLYVAIVWSLMAEMVIPAQLMLLCKTIKKCSFISSQQQHLNFLYTHIPAYTCR